MININATLDKMLENREIQLFASVYGNPPENTFPEKIYKLRMVNGMSLEKFAKTVDVSISTVQAWETGAKVPNKTSLNKICSAFGLSIDELSDNT